MFSVPVVLKIAPELHFAMNLQLNLSPAQSELSIIFNMAAKPAQLRPYRVSPIEQTNQVSRNTFPCQWNVEVFKYLSSFITILTTANPQTDISQTNYITKVNVDGRTNSQ